MTALRWLAFLWLGACQNRPAVTDPCDVEQAKILAACAAEIASCPDGDDLCVDKAAKACEAQIDGSCR